MITEMVIGISEHHVKCDSAVKLSKILACINTTLQNEVNNVEM